MFLDDLPVGWIIPVYLLMIAGACLLFAGVCWLLKACEQNCCGEYTPPRKVYTNSENHPQSTTRVEDPGCPLCGRYWCKCYRLSYV